MTWIIIAIVAVVAIALVLMYNRFITLRNRTQEAWSDIDVQLKRRYDLIPNLVNTVKGYATHESEAFQKVTEARSKAMQAGTVEEHAEAENQLTGTLKSLFAIAEAYPDLKANANFLELQKELADTENKIQASRRFYNGTVMDLNTGIQSFPGNIIAKTFGFSASQFFELAEGEEAARKPVEVNFN